MYGLQPQTLHWRVFDAFPATVRIAFLVGRPGSPGPYVVRVRFPAGTKLMPHRHPQDRIYTVLEGSLFIGRGDKFDENVLTEYPSGSLVAVPGESHYQWAKCGDYVIQMTAVSEVTAAKAA